MDKITQKRLADEAGLSYCGDNEDGELEFIGTLEAFQTYSDLLENVCDECHGTGKVNVGEFDNIDEKDCICKSNF